MVLAALGQVPPALLRLLASAHQHQVPLHLVPRTLSEPAAEALEVRDLDLVLGEPVVRPLRYFRFLEVLAALEQVRGGCLALAALGQLPPSLLRGLFQPALLCLYRLLDEENR